MANAAREQGARSWQFKLAFVWGGELISTLTSSILQMGFIWHITLSTNSANMLSLASLAGFLPLALFGMFAGAIVDRLPLKRVLIGSDLFIAAVSAFVACVSLAGALPVWVVIAALFLRAIGTSFYTPAFQALTPHVAPSEHLTRLAGVTQTVQSGGYIAGTAAAAIIYPLWGLTAMIALDVAGALIAVCAIMAARLDLDEAVMPGDTDALDSRHSAEKACDARASDSGLAPGEFAADASDGANRSCDAFSGILATVRAILVEVDEGFKVLKGFRGLFALLWCGFAFTLVFAPISALFPIMVLDHFGGNTGDAALAEIVFAVGMIAGGALLATTGGFKNRAFTVVAATALYGMATIFAGLLGAGGIVAFFVAAFAMGFSSPFYSGPQTALMQEKVPSEFLGRVFGLYGSLMAWALPLGLVASSLFADAVGAPAWFAGAGVAMVVLAVITWAIPAIRAIERF